MLGDNPEKSKNPLKKAMRRRNTRAVAFAPPTFIEASDVEFTSDGEIEEGGDYSSEEEDTTTDRNEADLQDQASESKDINVDPLKPRAKEPDELEEPESVEVPQEPEQAEPEEDQQSPEELGQPQRKLAFPCGVYKGANSTTASEEHVSRSKNGTVRNTDSFFKDDSIETKKISLTPNLLRDELGSTNGSANEGKEVRIKCSR